MFTRGNKKLGKGLPNRKTADRIPDTIRFAIMHYEITFRHVAMVQVIACNQRAVNINNFTIIKSSKKTASILSL